MSRRAVLRRVASHVGRANFYDATRLFGTICCDFERRGLVLTASVFICLYNKFVKFVNINLIPENTEIHLFIKFYNCVNCLLMTFLCFNATWHDSRM